MNLLDDLAEIAVLFAEQPAAMREKTLDRLVDVIPTTDDALHKYIHAFYGYRIARNAVCPGHVAPFQGVADLFFSRNPGCDQVWVGGRGVGKTLNLSIAEHMLLRFHADTIANIGSVEAQAEKFYSYLVRHATLPRFFNDLTMRPLMSKTYFRNGGFLEVMPATMNRLNSPHSRLACLAGDTQVLTRLGLRRIDSMSPGNVVYSSSSDGKERRWRTVTHWLDKGVRQTIVLELSSGKQLRCTPDHLLLTRDGWKKAEEIAPLEYLISDLSGTFVLRKHAGKAEAVYDLTVDGPEHNFFANGVVVHNCVDEVDLCGPKELEEASSIPVRTNDRPPQMVFTSSLKFAYGPMVKLMNEAAERNRRVYTFCVFEVIQTCEPERHQNGAGCVTCPLAKECLDEAIDPVNGATTLLPGPGKAARADGFMSVADVIKMYQGLDSDTWDSQWRCKRPSSKGLIYPQFGEHHVIDFMGKGDSVVGRYNPNLPVYAGVDFGFANATAVVYLQETADHRIVAFAEDYQERRISEDTAAAIKATPWFGNLAWIVGDPAAADARMTLRRHGVKITPADNAKDPARDGSGIAKIRWALAPQGGVAPFLFVDERCVNLLREIRAYHNPESRGGKNVAEAPVKADDHAVDAFRYGVAKIIKRTN